VITLFGATGYTGVLVAGALDRAGLPFRLAGRSAARLAALAQSLPSHPPALIADVSQPHSLPALFAGTRLLINCAGPFTDLGEPVVALAAAHGVHYLDITNELAYVLRLRQYDALARQTGAAIVPACGFEVAVTDCALAALTRGTGRVDEVDVTYALHGSGMSLGTRLSGLRIFATSGLAFRDGKLRAQPPGNAVRRTQINGREVSGLAFPSSELGTLPLHLPVENVRVWMAIARRAAGLAPLVVPLVSTLLRTPLGGVTAQVVKRMLRPPAPEVRTRDRFGIKLEVRAGDVRREQTWLGPDPYWLTGEIAAYAARVMTAPDYDRRGVLAPAQALDAEAFLNWLKSVEGVRELD
jgi:short subunit dehydrogenase-like uncharacterized protein